MASIREQLNNGFFTVENHGYSADFDFPEWMNIPNTVLDDEQSLVDYCKQAGVLHNLLHTGLQQEVINCRAISKVKDKDGKALPYTDKMKEEIQKKLDERKPFPMPDPSKKKSGEVSPDKAIAALLKSGKTAEEITAMILAAQNK